LLKEVAELMAVDGKQRPSKSGMQTCRGLPANLTRTPANLLIVTSFTYPHLTESKDTALM